MQMTQMPALLLTRPAAATAASQAACCSACCCSACCRGSSSAGCCGGCCCSDLCRRRRRRGDCCGRTRSAACCSCGGCGTACRSGSASAGSGASRSWAAWSTTAAAGCCAAPREARRRRRCSGCASPTIWTSVSSTKTTALAPYACSVVSHSKPHAQSLFCSSHAHPLRRRQGSTGRQVECMLLAAHLILLSPTFPASPCRWRYELRVAEGVHINDATFVCRQCTQVDDLCTTVDEAFARRPERLTHCMGMSFAAANVASLVYLWSCSCHAGHAVVTSGPGALGLSAQRPSLDDAPNISAGATRTVQPSDQPGQLIGACAANPQISSTDIVALAGSRQSCTDSDQHAGGPRWISFSVESRRERAKWI